MNAYSVVIPAFNAAATLAETIESVLAQTVVPQDIIVVDDGCEIVERQVGPPVKQFGNLYRI